MGVGVQGPPGNRHGCARAPVQQQTGDVHTGSVQQGAGVQGLAHNSFTVCKDTCAMGAGVQGCLCPRRAGTSVQRDRWRAARCQDRCPTQHLECGQVCNGGGVCHVACKGLPVDQRAMRCWDTALCRVGQSRAGATETPVHAETPLCTKDNCATQTPACTELPPCTRDDCASSAHHCSGQ